MKNTKLDSRIVRDRSNLTRCKMPVNHCDGLIMSLVNKVKHKIIGNKKSLYEAIKRGKFTEQDAVRYCTGILESMIDDFVGDENRYLYTPQTRKEMRQAVKRLYGCRTIAQARSTLKSFGREIQDYDDAFVDFEKLFLAAKTDNKKEARLLTNNNAYIKGAEKELKEDHAMKRKIDSTMTIRHCTSERNNSSRRNDGPIDLRKQAQIIRQREANFSKSPILQQAFGYAMKLEDLTNHWSGKLPNLYSSSSNLSDAIRRGDLTMAHGFTVKLAKELSNSAKLYKRPEDFQYGLGLIRRIRACLAKAGF